MIKWQESSTLPCIASRTTEKQGPHQVCYARRRGPMTPLRYVNYHKCWMHVGPKVRGGWAPFSDPLV